MDRQVKKLRFWKKIRAYNWAVYLTYVWALGTIIATLITIFGDFLKKYQWLGIVIDIILVGVVFGVPVLLLKSKIWERLKRWFAEDDIYELDRFFPISRYDDNIYFRIILERDEENRLLERLISDSKDNPIDTIKMGLHYSNAYYLIGDYHSKIINGIWILIAVYNKNIKLWYLEKIYAKAHSYIMDIGWGFYMLKKYNESLYNSVLTEITEIIEKSCSNEEIKQLLKPVDKMSIEEKFIKKGIDILDDYENHFHYLRSNAFGILCSSQILKEPSEVNRYKDLREKEIKKIKSRQEKGLMKLGVKEKEIKKRSESNDCSTKELEKLYQQLKEIKDDYDFLFKNQDRVGKCFYPLAQILISIDKMNGEAKNKTDVIKTFNEGITHNEKIKRYEVVAICCLGLAKYYKYNNQDDEAAEIAKKGLKYAETLRNKNFEEKFNKIISETKSNA